VLPKRTSSESKVFSKRVLKTDPAIQFEKIHTSVDFGDQCPKFLVAYANDAIFIAFRAIDIRTLKDYDIANGFPVNASSARGHLYQGAGFQRSQVFNVGSPHFLLLEVLCSKPKRCVILCGQGSGGAVSQVILLRFLLDSKDLKEARTVSHCSGELVVVCSNELLCNLCVWHVD
jgi:hypothetical protein